MHLSKEFGYSVNEIVKDGFKINEKVEMNPENDTGFSMAESIGKGLSGMAKALKKINPDFLLVLGDRIEALAGVIAAAYMNIPIAHIHGGDSTRAGLDESARHAITKFAHIHFTVTKKSAERVRKMGEDQWRIFIVGAPCLDTILNVDYISKNEIYKKFNLKNDKPFIVLLQHAVSTEPQNAEKQSIETLDALKDLGLQTVIIYPNSDAGGRAIIKQIKKYEKYDFIKSYKNLPQLEYLSLLKYSNVLVGNSSSGIIESSSFKLPVVNIGIRQDGRERANNVIDVSHDKNKITKAIEKALYDKKFKDVVAKSKNPYGSGKSSKHIVKVFREIEITPKLIQKKITY
jgi:UDP-N-acetylglucosamine 2-epimerase (non-hydrolysing)/GDP/UDP-N,N'-diacetylbacillosamine 2-epimerase (hydrolysing)